jgi:hypothetical protein
MVDESTNLKIYHFHAKKDGMVEPTCELIKKLKNMEIEIKILRMDNAGENKLLQQRCESKYWQFEINYEYTGGDTPQHNGICNIGKQKQSTNGKRQHPNEQNVPAIQRNIQNCRRLRFISCYNSGNKESHKT